MYIFTATCYINNLFNYSWNLSPFSNIWWNKITILTLWLLLQITIRNHLSSGWIITKINGIRYKSPVSGKPVWIKYLKYFFFLVFITRIIFYANLEEVWYISTTSLKVFPHDIPMNENEIESKLLYSNHWLHRAISRIEGVHIQT